jgi:predicted permease
VRTLVQDLRYGFRIWRHKPGTALLAVLTLAVGLAATTTVFSWIDNALLRPIPGVADPARLVTFESLAPDGGWMGTSYADFRDYRDHLKSVFGLAVAKPNVFSLGPPEHAERVWGELVSGNYFSVVGVRAEAGRTFTPEEYGDAEGAYPVAVISHGLWQRVFQSDPSAVGRIVLVNRQPITIVGVTPPEFRGIIGGLAEEIWIPAMMAVPLKTMPDWMLKDRHSKEFVAVARLRPGVTLTQARTEAAAMARRLSESYPNDDQGLGASLFPLWQGHYGAQKGLLAPLEFLMAIGCVVLLIVCANVANLQLARATGRYREFSVRMAVGAGRGRLVRQLLTESLVLTFLGSVAGATLTLWTSQTIGYLVPPSGLPVAVDVPMNVDILLFTIAVAAVACVVSGVVPALHASRANLHDVMREGGKGASEGAGSQHVRGVLVAAEIALALVATISAGLFARSFEIARRIDPGFDADNVAVSHVQLSTAGYTVPERKLLCERLQQRLETQPEIASASYSDTVPLGFDEGGWEELGVRGYVPNRNESMNIYRNVVSPGFFQLLRIPLVEGRDFTVQDDTKSQPVMIVNQTFARRYFGGGQALGRQVHGWGQWFTVIGVVRDSKHHSPNEAPKPYIYVAFRQMYRDDMETAIYVRARQSTAQGLAAMRREVRAMDPGLDLYDAMPLRDFIQASLFPQKIAASLVGVLGAIALVLAAIGLYSVMSYAISQRTREIGIRMALGAQPADVRRMVVRQGMAMAATGLTVGIAAAMAVTRLAASLLVKISPTDPAVFAGATVFLAAVALAASYLPARRATRIDPNTALRES